MKYLLPCLVLISFHSIAQIKTGGGGIIDPISVFPDSKDETSIGHEGMASMKVKDFISALAKQEKKCRESKHKLYDLDKRDLTQIYLKFAIYKTDFYPDTVCKDADTYFKCIYTPKVKKHMEAMVKDPHVPAYLMKKHKITQEQAKNLLEFFEKLDK